MKNIVNIFRIDVNGANRTYGLDIMRSLAILIVVFGHAFLLFQPWYEELIPGTHMAMGKFMSNAIDGFDGVDLFFVLSGFLIGSILVRLYKNSENFGFSSVFNFWKRRWLRTIPAYFFILLLNILFVLCVFKDVKLDAGQTAKYFVFCQNLLIGDMSFFPESWSLSVEEWFYLSLPVLMTFAFLALNKMVQTRHLFLGMLVVYFCIIIYIRLYYGWGSRESWNVHFRTPVLMRLDTILFGVLAAWCKFYFPAHWTRYRKICFVSGLFIIVVNFYIAFIAEWPHRIDFFNTFYFTFIGLGMVLLIPLADSLKTGKGRLFKFFTYTSLVSYSMYLVNYSLVLKTMEHYFAINNMPKAIVLFFAFWILVYIFSVLSYKFVELPVLKYRDKISKKDSPI